MRKFIVFMAASSLLACSNPTEPGTTPVAWSGSSISMENGMVAEGYHLDSLARAHEYLDSNHLLGVPFTNQRVEAARDMFLQTIGQDYWLHAEELEELKHQSQLPRWRAALEGQHLGVAVEVAALVRHRQKGWVQEHGPQAGPPENTAMSASQSQWDEQRRGWAPEPMSEPLKTLDADGATQALLAARAWGLDPNTRHVPPEVAHLFNEDMLRVSSGLGVGFSWMDGNMVVRSIEEDSPAGRSGLLREGDVLKELRLEGGKWIGARRPDLVLTLLDEAVNQVDLAVVRDGQLIRLTIPMPSAEEKKAFSANEDQVRVHLESWGQSQLSVMRIEATLFYESGDDGHSAAVDVANALANATEQQVDLVVLDLRRSRGGAVPVAIETAGLFVEGGPLFHLWVREGERQVIDDPHPGIAWEGPTQVWVGPQTMSAGEIVAMAVGDQAPQATVLGWPTFGKGTLQRRVEMDLQAVRADRRSRLGEIWVTMGEITAVDGTSIQYQGVPLDFQIIGGVDEPWGERGKAGSLKPRKSEGTRPHPEVIDLNEWFHPGMDDQQSLPMWQRAGLIAIDNQNPPQP